MKKVLLLLTSAVLLLAGCAKEQIGAGENEGGLVEATFTASIDGGVATKAFADNDGNGAKVNRCIMEIYFQNQLYKRMEAAMSGTTATATFANVPVVAGKEYEILFWADHVDVVNTEAGLATDKYYTTKTTTGNKGLKAVTVKKADFIDALKNKKNDELDAFFFADNYTVPQGGKSYTAKLKRPFAQLNVITTDVGEGKTVVNANLLPEKVSVSYTAATTFNVADSTVTGSATYAYEAPVYGVWSDTKSELTLSMDYILASTEQGAVDVTFKTKNGTTEVMTHNLTNLPYKRNYRTNVKGELLTTGGTWTATIAPAWEGNGTSEADPYLVNFFAAGSIAAANEALKTNNAVSIENPTDLGADIVIPEEQDRNKVFITVTGASSNDIVVKKAADGPASLAIESDSKTLNIDLPNSHVDLNKGNFTGVTANTSATTLVVGKDVEIETLTINGGNAKIYGLVDEINRADGVKAEFYVSNSPTLAKHITLAKSGDTIDLECDIDLVGITFRSSPVLNADFNGNNHIIKNIKNPTCAPDYAGLFKVSYSNIKNVTIQNAEFAYGATMDARGGALVGDMRRGSIENCHVDGIKFDGYQKVGGLVGFLSANADNGTDISIKNCSVKNATFAACGADDKYLYQTGGLIGYLVLGNRNISISNCSVETIKYGNAHNGVFNDASDNHGYLSHTFVGTIFSQTNNAANTLAFTANTISGDNTPLNASMYGSAYFGWARNPEYSDETVTLGKITIDGEEWTPNYPVKIVGGKGYATLDAALSAATEGQTVQILKAGDYTVQTLSTKAAVVEATVEGVVFNRTAGGWVAAQTENVKTVKNITWNVGNGSYQYFSNTNLENCTVNGILFTHMTNKFKDCTFINEEGYNFWVYGNVYTEFDNCTFTCPGKNDGAAGCGSALNCYNESAQTPTPVLVVKNCTFTAKEASNKYSAIYVKPQTAFDIRITNSTCNDKFFTGAISGSKLWNLTADREGTTVSIDGNMVYPFSMDADGNYSVKNVNGLKMAIKHWNALKAAGEKSLTLADGTYNVSDMAIFQNYADKSLLIKAENEKQAVITPTAGSKQLIFVVAGMSKTYAGHITIDGIKFDFSNASNKDIESDVISISDATGTNLPADEKDLYSGTYHYGHDITVKNCEIIGLGINNKLSSVVRTENQNAYNVKIQNCVIDKIGYVLTSKITTLAEVSGCTITDSKCVINNTVDGTEYKVFGNTISSYNDYCIRVNFGPLTVSNNEFDCTYSGIETEAGVVVLRGSTGNKATITGNTFTKASAAMNDVYCITSWEIDNGDVTKTIPANTGIKDISKLSELEL